MTPVLKRGSWKNWKSSGHWNCRTAHAPRPGRRSLEQLPEQESLWTSINTTSGFFGGGLKTQLPPQVVLLLPFDFFVHAHPSLVCQQEPRTPGKEPQWLLLSEEQEDFGARAVFTCLWVPCPKRHHINTDSYGLLTSKPPDESKWFLH